MILGSVYFTFSDLVANIGSLVDPLWGTEIDFLSIDQGWRQNGLQEGSQQKHDDSTKNDRTLEAKAFQKQ